MLQRLILKENENMDIWHIVLPYKCWSSNTKGMISSTMKKKMTFQYKHLCSLDKEKGVPQNTGNR
jgi:hypothetical protein